MSGKEIQELLPCPFCGGTPKKILIGNDFTKKRSVEVKCTGCFTKQVTGAIRNSHEWCDKTATTVWNTRQLSPSSTAPQWETYTRSEVEGLLNRFCNEVMVGQAVGTIPKHSNGIAQYIIDNF